MNPEVKKKWIEKLRSGTFKQGTGRLRNHPGQYGGNSIHGHLLLPWGVVRTCCNGRSYSCGKG